MPAKVHRIAELEALAAQPDFWNDLERAQKLGRERAQIEGLIKNIETEARRLEDAQVLIELGIEAGDNSVEVEARNLLAQAEATIYRMELRRMMAGKFDPNNAYLEVHPGSGGTDSADWAEMLLRMYTRWCQKNGFEVEEVDYQSAEEAGIKSATILVKGEWAYGWLRAEQGVHRLVRISPFDSNARRQTSFASVSVFPELEDEVDVDIDWEKDVKEDTMRSGGAGGQHVNKTESAVRLTHIPTGLVVKSQSERSQHKNRSTARKMLTARLYEMRVAEQQKEHAAIAGEKAASAFGSQIRSYVNHPYQMVKDHRTEFEVPNFDAVLNGELEGFMEAYLLANAPKAANLH